MNIYKYGTKSLALLEPVHPDLKVLFMEAIKGPIDITILPSTLRSIQEQKALFDSGKSKTMDSLHLPRYFEDLKREAVCAVDAAQYPIQWDNRERFIYLGAYLMGIATRLYEEGKMKHRVRWGGDWKNTGDPTTNTFFDGPHIELVL